MQLEDFVNVTVLSSVLGLIIQFIDWPHKEVMEEGYKSKSMVLMSPGISEEEVCALATKKHIESFSPLDPYCS